MAAGSRIPVEITGFVGRRREMTRVRKQLSMARIVTLTGVGGVGKSRLALQVARTTQATFSGGVRVVDLAVVRDPSTLVHALLNALDIPAQAAGDPETMLVRHLETKRILLVLDNCEHLREECSRLVSTVLRATSRVRVLVTSREPLGAQGELIWQVPPLAVAASDRGDNDAVRLFEERATAAHPGFSVHAGNERLVRRLCRRLDGLPLAIELAAARMRTCSLEWLLTNLEDRYRAWTDGCRGEPLRHQTIETVLEWSHDLCTHFERTMWARSSVFTGGFDLDAARCVCSGDELPAEQVLAAISGLVDKSILVCEEDDVTTRYRMQETVRQYGEAWIGDGAERVRLRRLHRDCYYGLAREAEGHSFGPGQAEWLSHLRAEDANLWTALGFTLCERDDSHIALWMASALWLYWIGSGLVREGRYWLRRALDAERSPGAARAKALWVEAWCGCLHGDGDGAMESLRECQRLAREQGDELTMTHALQFIGNVYLLRGEFERGVEIQDETVDRYRRLNERSGPAMIAFLSRADIASMLGDVALAHALSEECATVAAARGERWTLSWAQWNLGVVWWIQGDLDKATAKLRASLRNKIALHDLLGIPFCVESLACVFAAAGRAEDATVLLGITEQMWVPIGKPSLGHVPFVHWREQAAAQAARVLGHNAYQAARGRGARLTFEEAMAYAVGDAAVPQGPLDPRLGCAETRREEIAELVASGFSNRDIASLLAQGAVRRNVERLIQRITLADQPRPAPWPRWHHGQ